MNKEIIKAAINDGTLRKYDLTQAQAGDKVLGWEPGEVLAIYGEDVVIGWDLDDGKSADIFLTNQGHRVYLAPLCWVEDKPVYKGDVLYSPNGTVKVRTIDRVEKFQAYDDEGKAITRLRVYGDDGLWDSPKKLTWVEPEPEPEYTVEGKVLKVGDTLFSKDGDKVTVEAFEMGFVITTPGQVMGNTQWATDYLSWTNPTILFEVEGKPVRKGDVLYGTWMGSKPIGYEITGKNDVGWPMWRGGVLTDKPEKLTWTKPKAPPLNINGHVVHAPEREPLPEGTMYYVPRLFSGKADFYRWGGDGADHHFLRSGLIHLTEGAATAHAQALISLTKS